MNKNFGLEDIPLIRGGNLNDLLIYKRCRVYCATENFPFGYSGNNDCILVNHWYVGDSSDDSFAYQIAYNIREDQISFRRYYKSMWNDWKQISFT